MRGGAKKLSFSKWSRHLSHWCHTELEIMNKLIYSQLKSVTENFAIW